MPWTGHRLAGMETPTEKSGCHGHAADQQPGNWRRAPQGLGQTTPRSYPNVFLPPLIEGQVGPAFTRAIGPQVAFHAQRVLPRSGINHTEKEVALVIFSWSWHEGLHALTFDRRKMIYKKSEWEPLGVPTRFLLLCDTSSR